MYACYIHILICKLFVCVFSTLWKYLRWICTYIWVLYVINIHIRRLCVYYFIWIHACVCIKDCCTLFTVLSLSLSLCFAWNSGCCPPPPPAPGNLLLLCFLSNGEANTWHSHVFTTTVIYSLCMYRTNNIINTPMTNRAKYVVRSISIY